MRALITGGSRGLGLAIAQAMAAHHIPTTLIARNRTLLQQAVASLPGDGHRFQVVDVGRHWDEVRYDDATILVNCAGIGDGGLLMRTRTQSMLDVVGTNLVAPMGMSRDVLRPFMKLRSSNPVVVNVALVLANADLAVAPGTAVYAATKAGLVAFTRLMAVELKGAVRFNAVLPGLMDTDMGRAAGVDVPMVPVETVAEEVVRLALDPECNGECTVIA